MTTILHITTRAAWEEARSIGLYEAASLRSEGFIHFSTASQVESVANNFYAGQRDLALLVVDTERLTSPLKWEAPVHPSGADAQPSLDGQFPHLYGPLNLDAVTRVLEFPFDANGHFTLPDGLN